MGMLLRRHWKMRREGRTNLSVELRRVTEEVNKTQEKPKKRVKRNKE